MEELSGLKLHDLGYLAPELALVASFILLLLLDMLLPVQFRSKQKLLDWLTVLSTVISAVFIMIRLNVDEPVTIMAGSYRIDGFANLLGLVLAASAGLISFMSTGFAREGGARYEGRQYYLFLPAVLGGMIMASSMDLIPLFAGMEVLGMASYVLVGRYKKAGGMGFKHLLLGGISSAIVLYGMSFLYGVTGSTNLLDIRQALDDASAAASSGPLIYAAAFLLLAGFGCKLAVSPFRAEASAAPVYGASTPIAAFLAVVPKAAVIAAMFRIFMVVFNGLPDGSWQTPVGKDVLLAMAALAAAFMIGGTAMALKQKDLKGLLACISLANAGVFLVPIATGSSLVHYSAFQELIYYFIAYLFMMIGAFAMVMIMEHSTGGSGLASLAGLYYRAPWSAAAMSFIVLSMAGLPVTGGFFGKLFIVFGTVQNHQYWLGAVVLGASAISAYNCFGLIRQMYMRYGQEAGEIRLTMPLCMILWLCAAAGVLMGFFPHRALDGIRHFFSYGTDFWAF